MKNIQYNFIGIATGLVLSSTGVHAAYNDAGTEYTTETVESWIDMGAAMEPLNFSDFLVCLLKKTAADQIVNGTYDALTDSSKCQTGQGASKPEIAKMTVVTSRADNSSPQLIKIWFDAGSDSQYIVNANVTESVSATAPYGSFSFSWQNANDAAEKGTMKFASGDTASTVKMARADPSEGFTWLNGTVSNNKETGQVAVGIDTDSYVLSFDKVSGGHVNTQKEGSAAECYDRDALAEYVFGYNLYDPVTGARKNLAGPFQCSYDSSGTTKQCHIGPYGAWFEGGETTSVTSVTHEDGTVYSGITYDESDANNDGVYITISGYTFDPPINFAKADQTSGVGSVQAAMGNNTNLQYYGPRDLYGLPWLCSTDGINFMQDDNAGNCSAATTWRPGAKLSDGAVLTDMSSNTYVAKATATMKVMETEPGACSALPLTSVSTAYPALTASDITAVTSTWADKPVVTGAPIVVEGVLQ